MLVTAALAVAGVVSLPAAPALAASNVQVFVGYADNLRANPVDFPTSWAGSPSVVFEGCTPNCTFDVTVNAVHIKALGLLDVVLASSSSDIHHC